MNASLRVSSLLFFLLAISLNAQDLVQNVYGTVLDVDTRVPLSGAVVRIITTDPPVTVQCNADGEFDIEGVPVGRHSFHVSLTGYRDRVLRSVLVSSGKETELPVLLQERVSTEVDADDTVAYEMNPPLNPSAVVSARSFTPEDTERYAASVGDPARVAQSFAGVAALNDENNEIAIRGNAPSGLLWRLEGIEILNPNHLRSEAGESGGRLSLLSNTVLGTSDFYTSAFPAEYGNALSGVFDMHFRKGNSRKNEFTLQLGTQGVQAGLEGPLPVDGGSWLLNYRYSMYPLLDQIGIRFEKENGVAPEFHDVNFNVHLPVQNLGSFSIWGVGGISEGGTLALRDSTQWKMPEDVFQRTNRYTTALAGLTHRYTFPNNQTYIRTVLSAAQYESKERIDAINREFELDSIWQREHTYTDYQAAMLVRHKISPRHVVQIGGEFSGREYRQAVWALRWPINILQAFTSWQYRPSESFTMNTGLHYLRFLFNGTDALEPRLSARMQLAPRHSLSYATGLYSSTEPLLRSYFVGTYFTYLADTIEYPNRDLRFTRAVHNVLSYDWNIAQNLHLRTEVYHHYLFDVPVDQYGNIGSMLNNPFYLSAIPMVNGGTGTNYGLEITAEKSFDDDYYFLASASLFESTYSMDDTVNVPLRINQQTVKEIDKRNTRYNASYILNVLGGKEFRVGRFGQNVFGVNARIIWRGGYRETPYLLEAAHQYGAPRNYNRYYEQRLPDYYRIDLGVSYRSNHEGLSWRIGADVQNLTDRRNPNGTFYNLETKEVEYHTDPIGILPTVNFAVEF